MKKYLAFLLVAVLLLTAGCTRSLQGLDRKETEEEETAPTKDETTQATEEDPAPAPTPEPVQQDKVYIYQLTKNEYNGTVEEQCTYNSYGDQEQYVLNGSITRRVFEYNAQGQRTKATVYLNYNELDSTYEYIYEDGLWTETVSRDAQGQVVTRANFYYDSQGRRTGMMECAGDTFDLEQLVMERQWEYDADGNVIRESEFSQGNYIVREYRYEDGRLTGWYEMKNGTQTYDCRYVYENGCIVRDEWLDTDGNVGTTYHYTYNGDTCTLTGTDGRIVTFTRKQVTLEQARVLWLRYGATSCFIEQ